MLLIWTSIILLELRRGNLLLLLLQLKRYLLNLLLLLLLRLCNSSSSILLFVNDSLRRWEWLLLISRRRRSILSWCYEITGVFSFDDTSLGSLLLLIWSIWDALLRHCSTIRIVLIITTRNRSKLHSRSISLALLRGINLRWTIITLGRVVQRSIVIAEVVIIAKTIGIRIHITIVDLIYSIIIILCIVDIGDSITIAVHLVKVDMQWVTVESRLLWHLSSKSRIVCLLSLQLVIIVLLFKSTIHWCCIEHLIYHRQRLIHLKWLLVI